MATTYNKPFSIENFKELFENSEAKKFLPPEALAQINDALGRGDEAALEPLYPTLVELYNSTQGIMADFLAQKDKLMEGFNNECIDVEKKYIEEPQKKARAKAEKEDAKAAEKLLKKI